ncbi:MAG: ribonuclease HI family protein [Promethearchaeota archaeon]
MTEKELKLFTDGCARGNPGPAGAGYVITDMSGSEIDSGFKFLGKSETNNQAEYGALIVGLSKCRNHSKGIIHVYSDSELMVKQLNGAYRINKPHLKKLADNVRLLMEGFQKVTFHHIKRDKNSRADELANQAVDQALKM